MRQIAPRLYCGSKKKTKNVNLQNLGSVTNSNPKANRVAALELKTRHKNKWRRHIIATSDFETPSN